MKYAVVCGSLNMDLVCRGPRIPMPGETILGYDFNTNIGGKGGNQAVALAKLGVPTHMIGCVGEDAYGDEILESLNKNCVQTDKVIKCDTSTATAHIMIEDSGENNIVVIPSANACLSPKHIMESESLISDADVLLTQLEIPLDTVREFLLLGKKHNVLTVLNPAPTPPEGIPDELMALVDMLTPNEIEMKFLTGIDIVDMDSFTKASGILHDKGVKQVICTVGSKGAYYSNMGKVYFQKAYEVKAVDTTCAGDSFNGAIIAKLQEGEDILQALDFAAKVAALTVTKKGAQDSIPTRDEVEAFIG